MAKTQTNTHIFGNIYIYSFRNSQTSIVSVLIYICRYMNVVNKANAEKCHTMYSVLNSCVTCTSCRTLVPSICRLHGPLRITFVFLQRPFYFYQRPCSQLTVLSRHLIANRQFILWPSSRANA